MDFICEYKKSMPDSLCESIIKMYESEEIKHEGMTIGGIKKHVKDTTDFKIPMNNDKWRNIEILLFKELKSKLSKYLKKHNKIEYFSEYTTKSILFTEKTYSPLFFIQKYDKQKGKYVYHNDFNIENGKSRIITFIWYLNTVEEGGETVFWDNYKIKPEQGKLVLFPSFWCFPHCGKMPLSSDKYIITGWLFSNG